MLEKDIQHGILQYLRLRRYFVWKSHNVGIKKENGHFIPPAMRGVSDIIGLTPSGRFLAIEVKQPGKQPTPEQLRFLENINGSGGLGLVARSIDDIQAAGL